MADFGLSALGSLGTAEILSLGGTALELIGGIGQSVSQARQAKDQAKAIDVETDLERRQQERRNRQIFARNRAVSAGSGVDPFSGSPLEIELANAFEGGMNDALIKYSGDTRSRQARLSASQAYGQIPGVIGGGLLQGGSILGGWFRKSKGPTTPGLSRGGVGYGSAGGRGGGYIY